MKELKNTIAKMGFSLGCYSAATLTLGTVTLIGTLAFQGVIRVENGLERIEKPVYQLKKRGQHCFRELSEKRLKIGKRYIIQSLSN